jgi:hypothetical protein
VFLKCPLFQVLKVRGSHLSEMKTTLSIMASKMVKKQNSFTILPHSIIDVLKFEHGHKIKVDF